MLHQRVNHGDHGPDTRDCHARCPPRTGSRAQELGAHRQQLGSSSCQYPDPTDGSSPHGCSEVHQPSPGTYPVLLPSALLLQSQPRCQGWGNMSRLFPASSWAIPWQKVFRSSAAPSTELWGWDSAHPLGCHVKSSPQPAPPGAGWGDEVKPSRTASGLVAVLPAPDIAATSRRERSTCGMVLQPTWRVLAELAGLNRGGTGCAEGQGIGCSYLQGGEGDRGTGASHSPNASGARTPALSASLQQQEPRTDLHTHAEFPASRERRKTVF